MKNLIALHRQILKERNYIRKTKTSFFGFYESVLQEYRSKFGTDFNLILFVDENKDYDYYIIPYSFLASYLTDYAMDKDRRRWFGDIKSHVVNLRISRDKIDISRFYGLPYTINDLNTVEINIADAADYAIENAKREIAVRVGQSKFRKLVLENFKSRCCISGIEDKDLLVASHIIPWSEDKNRRLDPSNGLCLFTLYDQLFDKGYFTITEAGVIETTSSTGVSQELKNLLQTIQGKKIGDGIEHQTCKIALAFHRENIFKKGNEHNVVDV